MQEVALSFHYVGPWDGMQDFRLGGRSLSLVRDISLALKRLNS